MDMDEQLIFRGLNNSGAVDTILDLEDSEDLAAVESRVSVVSSEWGNVSSSSSSSSAENQLSAKDIVNWREFWGIWSNHHRVLTASIRSIPLDHPLSQDVYGVFQHVYTISRSRFHMHPSERNTVPHTLQVYLSHIARNDPMLLSDNEAVVSPYAGDGLAVAVAALEIHEAAVQLMGGDADVLSDERWAAEIHDALITRCARGRLVGASETLLQPVPHHSHPDSDSSPTAARILSVRKIRPRGTIAILPEGVVAHPNQPLAANGNAPQFFAAAFTTRSQIVSHLRDTPEPVALHSFSVMTTKAILFQLSTFGINLPVFGVMFDRNIVRFHVDWSVTYQGRDYTEHISLPLAQMDGSSDSLAFKEFDLTRPEDSLRVAFILDSIHSYAESRLAPAVRTTLNSCQWISDTSPSNRDGLPFAKEEELSSKEKVQAWMRSGAVDAVGD